MYGGRVMSPEQLDAYTRLFSALGFPAATAAFLLWYLTKRLNGQLERLARTNEELTAKLDDLADRIAEKIELVLRRGLQ